MKTITQVLISLLSIITFAQQGINYKAIIKDGSGNVVGNQSITIQFIIYQGTGTTTDVYQETHSPITDTNGIIIVNIGEGSTSDDFTSIDWAADDHYLNTQIDTGSGLTDMGTTQFMAVPYALHARTADYNNLTNTPTIINPTGLESINEGNGVGHRVIGRITDNHGNIGLGAIDLSYSEFSGDYGATGAISIAMGSQTTASGLESTAMGYATTASGFASTAMGSLTTASGGRSTAMGIGTTASGAQSTALGANTTASGALSTAMGVFTKAESRFSTAIGFYNIGGGDPFNLVATDPLFEIGNGTSTTPSNALTVLKNGYVGIGTHTPAYPLDITTIVGGLNSTPAHYLAANSGVGTNGTGWTYSIGTSAGVYSAIGFATGSDNRIKDIIGVSNSNKDLKTLMALEITDYTFKDYKTKGDRVSKKVIAQQVKEVLPNAVNLSTEFIPNVYELATVESLDHHLIQLNFNKQPEVLVGDKIKLITKTNSEVITIVKKVLDRSIVIEANADNWGDKIFAYGKQINDFHSVDYDAISMLNVSATQEQQKLIEQLLKENKELKQEVGKMATLEKEMATIKAMLFTHRKTTNTITQN